MLRFIDVLLPRGGAFSGIRRRRGCAASWLFFVNAPKVDLRPGVTGAHHSL